MIKIKPIILTGLILFSHSLPKVSAESIEHKGIKINLSDIAKCLSCHNEMKEHSHPVLVNYPPKGKESRYATTEKLQELKLYLLNGKIVCTTCHDLNNNKPNFLIVTNNNSKLCTSCHTGL